MSFVRFLNYHSTVQFFLSHRLGKWINILNCLKKRKRNVLRVFCSVPTWRAVKTVNFFVLLSIVCPSAENHMEECFTRDTQSQRKYGHYALLISWLCHSHTLFHSAHSHSLLFYLTLNFLSSNSFHFAFPNSLYQHFILPPLTTTTTVQLHYTNQLYTYM